MTFVTLALGLILILGGFVILIRKVHDRSMHETFAQLTYAHGATAPALSAFVSLLVPIVSSIASGLAFLAVAVLSR